uniref:Uncharacterized protein n=1 Tax=Meloidogyne incognita TaxID=6306 RepID=A0A914P5J2_MELIC
MEILDLVEFLRIRAERHLGVFMIQIKREVMCGRLTCTKKDGGTKVPEPGNPTGGGAPGGNNGLPAGYKCTTGCNPSSIKLKAEKGQPSPVDEGPTEKNGCQIDVLSCTTKQPIATITFGTQGSLKSNQPNKNNVRAKVICANEEATGKKGWVRNGVDNNPKLIFVDEAHCEQTS